MLEAGPISLLTVEGAAFEFLLMREVFQQTFTSTRPVAPESYEQDLAEFLTIFAERKNWTRSLIFKAIPGLFYNAAIANYITVPGYADQPSQFCLITGFSDPADAAAYRKHFYP